MPRADKAPKGWYSADVRWHIPGRKRPIAYSTVATNDLIVVLSEEGGTVQDVYDRIFYDGEAKKVLQEYVRVW